MTIQITFSMAAERMIIRIIGTNILFIDPQTNMMAPLEGLNFQKEGVIKEHPDLKDDPKWKQKAIQRFVDKIKSLPSEMQRKTWLIEEMRTMGYKPLYWNKEGWRSQKIK